ncbi:response regulator [Paraburkholderia sp. PREW-6R]|uniref:response regulator n=1 Tax=Paraburkholderia sp. PREW-6R TaxID=3141544 RepID=UPI0031F49E1D
MATVLLVDDEFEHLWALQIAMEAAGHRVLTAENGERALLAATRHLPDLIVTDWEMPVMDGLELCSRLTCYPSFAHIGIAMLSAQMKPAVLPPGCHAFFQKPVNTTELLRVTSSFLTRRLSAISASRPVDVAISRPHWPALAAKWWA